jgi:hypothetical protein
MHNLGQGIIASFEIRMAGVNHIRKSTQALVQELDRGHNAMAKELREDLHEAEGQRERESRVEIGQRTSDVSAWLKEYDEGHAAMGRELRADLAKVGPALHQAEAQREGEARQKVAQRRSDVGGMIKGFDQALAAMSRLLRADLSQVPSALHEAEGQREGEAQQQSAQRKRDVGAQLKEDDEGHAAMGRELRADLAKVGPALHQAEAQREQEARGEIAQRKAAVQALRDHVAAERAGAREEWQGLTSAMRHKRNGAAVVAEAPASSVIAEPAPTPTAPPPTAEEEVAGAIVGAVTEELTALGDRVFQYLANHPDGTRLTEIEREFGVGRLQAGRVVRHLMDEGKAEKRDFCYFAS